MQGRDYKEHTQRRQIIENWFETHGNRCPSAHLVFVTPSELPEEYVTYLCQNSIELWDKTFLADEFRTQIQEAEPSSFRLFFNIPNKELSGRMGSLGRISKNNRKYSGIAFFVRRFIRRSHKAMIGLNEIVEILSYQIIQKRGMFGSI